MITGFTPAVVTRTSSRTVERRARGENPGMAARREEGGTVDNARNATTRRQAQRVTADADGDWEAYESWCDRNGYQTEPGDDRETLPVMPYDEWEESQEPAYDDDYDDSDYGDYPGGSNWSEASRRTAGEIPGPWDTGDFRVPEGQATYHAHYACPGHDIYIHWYNPDNDLAGVYDTGESPIRRHKFMTLAEVKAAGGVEDTSFKPTKLIDLAPGAYMGSKKTATDLPFTKDDQGRWIPPGDPRIDGETGDVTHDWITCGNCGRTWDDSVVTGITPAPGAMCPFCNANAVEASRKTAAQEAPGYYVVSRTGASVAGPFATISDAAPSLIANRGAAVEYHSGIPAPADWAATKAKPFPYGTNTVNGSRKTAAWYVIQRGTGVVSPGGPYDTQADADAAAGAANAQYGTNEYLSSDLNQSDPQAQQGAAGGAAAPMVDKTASVWDNSLWDEPEGSVGKTAVRTESNAVEGSWQDRHATARRVASLRHFQ